MKKYYSFLQLTTAALFLSVAPLAAQNAPGKASDGVKEPATKPGDKETAPRNTTTSPSPEPGKASDGVKESTPKAATQTFGGKIVALNRDAQTVTVDDAKHGKHAVHVGNTTKLTKAGGTAAWADLKVGESVEGVCRKDGDTFHAESIKVGQ